MKLILLGPPGAGKGTQAEILSKHLDIPTISTGNILRAAVKAGTPTGLLAREYINAGKLVPDDVIMGIIKERLAQDDCKKGYILDGVPRTIPQAEAMEAMDIIIDKVLSIEIEDEVIVSRLSGRRTCRNCGRTYHMVFNPPCLEDKCDYCGGELKVRTDDTPETVRARLLIFHAETKPLKLFYEKRGKLVEVENIEGIEATTAQIRKALGI